LADRIGANSFRDAPRLSYFEEDSESVQGEPAFSK